MTQIEDVAEALKGALVDFDIEAIAPYLHDRVTWGECGTGADVVAFLADLKAGGAQATEATSVINGDCIVMSVDATFGSEARTIYQAAFVDGGKVVEIVDCQTLEEAMSAQRNYSADATTTAIDTPTHFESVAPVLPVADMAAGIAHYRGLGFEVESYDGGQFYAFARRGEVQLHLCRVADLNPKTTTTAIYLYVADAKALFLEWRDAGLDGRFGAPLDTDYGLLEAFHIDPWGNLLRYGSPIS